MRPSTPDCPSCRISTLSAGVSRARCRRSRVSDARRSTPERPRPDFRSPLAACLLAWRVGAHLLHGLAQIVLLFPRLPKSGCDRRVQAWARGMLTRLGIELQLVGAPAQKGPMLVVSNHVSWVDILALH